MSYFIFTHSSNADHYWRYAASGDGSATFANFSDPQQEFLRTFPDQPGRQCRFNFRKVGGPAGEQQQHYRITPLDAPHDAAFLRAFKGNKRATFVPAESIEGDVEAEGETVFEAIEAPAPAGGAGAEPSAQTFVFRCVGNGQFLVRNASGQLASVAGSQERATSFSLRCDMGNGAMLANRMPFGVQLAGTDDELYIACTENNGTFLTNSPGDDGLFQFTPCKTMWRDKKDSYYIGMCVQAKEQPKLLLNLAIIENADGSYGFAGRRSYDAHAYDEWELVPARGHLGRFWLSSVNTLPDGTHRVVGIDRSVDPSADHFRAPIVPILLNADGTADLRDAFYFIPREFPPSDEPGRDDLPPIGATVVPMDKALAVDPAMGETDLHAGVAAQGRARRFVLLLLVCAAIVASIGFSIMSA